MGNEHDFFLFIFFFQDSSSSAAPLWVHHLSRYDIDVREIDLQYNYSSYLLGTNRRFSSPNIGETTSLMTTQKPPSSRIISCHSTITERLLDTYRPRSQGLIIPNSSNVRIRNITRPEKRHRNQSQTTRFFFLLFFPFLSF